jgi:ABC-type branched-subunit amino acid transport system substrate-binding protein
MKRIAGLVVALAAALAGCGGEEDANTIPIAVVGPVTGQNASFGTQMKNGGGLAVEDINAAGRVLGKKLVLSIGDDACYPEQAVTVANQLTASNVVLAGTTDMGGVVKALNENEFDTVIGKFRFNEKGDPNLPPYTVYRWSNGTYEEIARCSWTRTSVGRACSMPKT